MNNQFDPKKPCRTRDGREVRIYATDGSGIYPIHGAIRCGEEFEVETWTSDGQQQYGSTYGRDLVNVTPDVVQYANIYDCGRLSGQHADRDKADMVATRRRIAVLKITIRDGRDVSVEVERA